MLRRFTSPLPAIAMAGLLILGLSERAHADLSVSLNGGAPTTASGNGTLTFALASGTAFASGSATGELVQGPASMDMSAVSVTSTAPAMVTLVFSMNNISSPVGPGTISELITGSFSFGTVGSIAYTTYGTNNNVLYTTVPLSPDGMTGTVTTLGGSSSGSFTAMVIPPNTGYSLTEVLSVTFSSAGTAFINLSSDSRASFTALPEPSSMAMAGLGALGFIAYGLRRRKAQGA